MARQLLDAGADPRRLDFAARNALDLAVLHGHLALVPPLLAAGCWFTSGADGDEAPPAQPAPGDPGAAQLELLRCLASGDPAAHAAFDELLRDGSEVLVESFRLSFAECAARGAPRRLLDCSGEKGWGRWLACLLLPWLPPLAC